MVINEVLGFVSLTVSRVKTRVYNRFAKHCSDSGSNNAQKYHFDFQKNRNIVLTLSQNISSNKFKIKIKIVK